VGGGGGGARGGGIGDVGEEKTHTPNSIVKVAFQEADVLAASPSLLKRVSTSHILTLLFTLNELFEQSLPGTLSALGTIIQHMAKGSLLIIADSFSDMSEVELKGKKFRVTLLLDNLNGLKKLHADDSRWYRVNKKWKYPVALQNVHYFLRVYQKT
jgi:25S rRNA (uracil2843-N3)-methyltransferase